MIIKIESDMVIVSVLRTLPTTIWVLVNISFFKWVLRMDVRTVIGHLSCKELIQESSQS